MLIKVCGLTRATDVRLCRALEVDWTGFIFHAKSPRCVTPEQVAAFDDLAPGRVGVFVSHTISQINVILRRARLDLVQLHGAYSPDDCRRIVGARVIKVFWPERYPDAGTLQADLSAYAPFCAFFLLDAGTCGGGHNRTLDQPWLARFSSPRPWILAGGLAPANLSAMLRTCRPQGVDVNSGVERDCGIKDRRRLEAAVNAIRRS